MLHKLYDKLPHYKWINFESDIILLCFWSAYSNIYFKISVISWHYSRIKIIVQIFGIWHWTHKKFQHIRINYSWNFLNDVNNPECFMFYMLLIFSLIKKPIFFPYKNINLNLLIQFSLTKNMYRLTEHINNNNSL